MRVAVALGAVLLAVSLAAQAPQVVRVRVPANDVEKWFPKGTELISRPRDDFEALVQKAERASGARSVAGVRLLHAAHRVRWDGGVLTGRSTLTIRRDTAAPVSIPLAPWNLAVESAEGSDFQLRTTSAGAVVLWLPPQGTNEVNLRWRNPAKPGSEGQSFDLELPTVPLSSLDLDLPDEFIAEQFTPAGPSEQAPEVGRRLWRRQGTSGPIAIRLRRASMKDHSIHDWPWISGPSNIDVGPASASWRADWTFEPNGPIRPLVVECSEGLELTDVSGPEVESFQASRANSKVMLTIRFRPEAKGRSRIVLRGLAALRNEAMWPLPAAKPVEAHWLGGNVTVRLDRSRGLRSCRVLQGRRLPPQAVEQGETTLLFEPERPGPVAELGFVSDDPLRTAEVRGAVRSNGSATNLNAEVRWTFPRGRPGHLALDIGPEWSVDRITSGDDTLAWYREPNTAGATRIRLPTPSVNQETSSYSIKVQASRTSPPGETAFALPRLRPVGVPADELWIATSGEGRNLVPREARGLAWIDPATVAMPSFRPLIDPAELARALAWRVTSDEALLQASVVTMPRESSAWVDAIATIAEGRISLAWRLSLYPGSTPLVEIPIDWSDREGHALTWRRLDSTELGRIVRTRRLLPLERAEFGLPANPATSESEAIVLPEPTSRPIVLEATLDRPWSGVGPIPLLRLPETLHGQGRLTIRVQKDLITRLDARQLKELEDVDPNPPSSPPAPLGASESLRLDHELVYHGLDATLRIETQPSIQRASDTTVAGRLTTTLEESGQASHQLILDFLGQVPASFSVKMPPGTELLRASRAQRMLEVVDQRGSLLILLGGSESMRSTRIVLDYVEKVPRDTPLRPTVPTFGFPCIRFNWRVDLPDGWEIGRVGTGLSKTEPLTSGDPLETLRAGSPIASWIEARDRREPAEKETLETLRLRILEARRPTKITLGAWLLGLASAPMPIVVDRLRLDAEGIGPSTPLELVVKGGVIDAVEPVRLELGDFCLVPLADAIVLTTRSAPELLLSRGDAAWAAQEPGVKDAASAGADPSARWVALEAWCQESGSRAGSVDAPRIDTPQGVSFLCNGWPGADAWVTCVPKARRLFAWLLPATALLMLGLVIRLIGDPWRSRVLALLTIVVLSVSFLASRIPIEIRAGLAPGIAAAWLIQPTRRGRSGSQSTEASSLSRRRTRSSAVARIGIILALSAGLAAPGHAAPVASPPNEPILVLLPYEGTADPNVLPTRVVLRLSDYERLRAATERRELEPSRCFAIEASHKIELREDQSAQVASEFSLVVEGDGPAEWQIPSAVAWEISATLDGRPQPVQILNEGQVSSVSVVGAGRHQLRFVRSLKVGDASAVDRLAFEINPVPRTVVSLSSPEPLRSIEVGRRPLESAPSSLRVEAELGPARWVRLDWKDSNAGREAGPPAGLSALVLWDAHPTGDLVRLRLRPSHPEGIDAIRLLFEPDVAVRVVDSARVVRSKWEVTADGPEWSSAFDPPLSLDDPVELEVWRGNVGPMRPTDLRRLPRIEVRGGRSFRGTIAFRRAGDWSGRLGPRSEFDSGDEEAFVKAWGRLPDDPYTLAGTSSFQRLAMAEVVTRPIAPRRTIKPAVRLDLSDGRIDAAIEATLTDVAGHSADLDVDVPTNFALDQVRTEGLTSLSRPTAGRIHLEFGPFAGESRKIVVRGHALSNPEGSAAEVQRFKVRSIWPRWSSAVEEPGTLTIVSTTRPLLEASTGVVLQSNSEPTAASRQAGPFRKVYQVEAGADAGTVTWQATAPRVAVSLRNRLAVSEESADLNATIRYDVAGGPLDVLYLRLPAVWAREAKVELVGDSYQLTSETRGDWMIWTIRPRRPIWGSARLLVRSTRELGAQKEIAFPDIIPLGQGSVDKLLAVERRTDAPLEIEGASGVQSVDISRFDDGPGRPTEIPPIGVYRVTEDLWTLKVRVGGADLQGASSRGRTSIRHATACCSLQRDGTTWGTSTLLVDAQRGSTLGFHIDPSSEVLSASAAGRPLPVLCSEPGAWSIPFADSSTVEVSILWRSRPAQANARSGAVDLPRFDQGDVPTLVCVHADPDLAVRGEGQRVEALSRPAWRIERVERLARRIVGLIADLDRGSTQEDELVSLLVRFSLDDRLASRAANASTVNSGATLRDQLRARLLGTRKAILESLSLYGLDDLRPFFDVLEKGVQVDLAGHPALLSQSVRPHLFPLGEATYYRTTETNSDSTGRILWSLRDRTILEPVGAGLAYPLLLAVLTLAVILGQQRWPGGGATRSMLLVLIALAPGPGLFLLLATGVSGFEKADRADRPL
jgi:hypothetical protein